MFGRKYMSIIFITIPGQQKRDFANELQLKTGNAIPLVIVQKTKYVKWSERFKKLKKTVGLKGLLPEFYYVLVLRMNSEYRNYIKFFFNFNRTDSNQNSQSFLPKVLEVDNINSDEVYNILQDLKPELLVVWGTNILTPRIYQSAKNAINLHMGIGEHYRGSVANHFAVLEDKRERIGAMIHKIDEKTDAGDVYKIIKPDLSLPPKELFTNLNDVAFAEFLDISYRLWKGENLETVPQNLANGKNVFLRQWTPKRRIIVAKKLKAWEQEFFPKKENSILQNTFLFAAFVLFAQFLGLFRDLYLLKIFGVGEVLDTYLLAFRIPDLMNVFYSLFLGSVIFIPLLTKAKKESEKNGEKGEVGIVSQVNKFGSLVLLLVTGVAGLLYLFMPALAHILAPNWGGAQLANLISMSRLLLFAQFFFPIGILAGVIGLVYNKPLGMAVSGAVYNLFILLGAVFLTPFFGIYGVIYGVIIGSIFFALVQIFPKEVASIFLNFRFKIFMEEWKDFFMQNIGRFFSVLLYQSYIILIIALAAFAGPGGVTIFNNAFHMYLSMFFILGATYSTALMPRNALMNINGEHTELKTSLETSLIYMFCVSLIFATFAFVFSSDIISIIFQFSDLTQAQTESIALVFAILCLSIPLLNTLEVVRKYMYATNLISYSVLVTGSFLVFLICVNYILQNLNIPVLSSLAAAIFFANLLAVIFVLNLLQRLKKLEISIIVKTVYKTLIISTLSAFLYLFFIHNTLFLNINYYLQLFINILSLFGIYVMLMYLIDDKVGKNVLKHVSLYISKYLPK